MKTVTLVSLPCFLVQAPGKPRFKRNCTLRGLATFLPSSRHQGFVSVTSTVQSLLQQAIVQLFLFCKFLGRGGPMGLFIV